MATEIANLDAIQSAPPGVHQPGGTDHAPGAAGGSLDKTAKSGDSGASGRQSDAAALSAEIFSSMLSDHGRDKLVQSASKEITSPEAMKQFQQDARDFGSRAELAGLSPADISATYEQVGRLLNGSGSNPLTREQRLELAEQVMHQAANPSLISQGEYNTCNVTTIESRTYSKYPAAAAKLVADVALDGTYTSPNGLTVAYKNNLADSREPHGQALTNPPKNGERSYASQLFQVTGINLHYQMLAKSDPNGFFQYEQHDDKYVPPGSPSRYAAPKGEILLAYPNHGKAQVVDWSPAFSADQMTEVMNDITGKSENGFILEHKSGVTSKTTTLIDSPAKLDKTLSQMKDDGQLPAVLLVADSDVLFSNYGSAGAHVVSVTDYDKATKTVSVANEAGSEDNYTGDKSLRMTDVYHSMVGSADGAPERKARLAHDLQARNEERGSSKPDTAVEWDYARDKLMADISPAQFKTFGKDVEDALAHTAPVWQKELDSNTLDDREARVAVRDMAESIAWLNGDQIQALMKQPYWNTAADMMRRYWDQVAISGLDDSRKKMMNL
jgi:hypothetical protein